MTGIVLAAVLGYLLGSVGFADLAARRASAGAVDLRSSGSGNPGATNVGKLLGRRLGIAVGLADGAKGGVAAALGLMASPGAAFVAGAAAVVGHCFPVWTRGRGGKGVATALGAAIVCFPAYLPLHLAVAALTWLRTRSVDAATLVACAVWMAAAGWWWWRAWPNLWGPEAGAGLFAWSVFSALLVMSRFAGATSSSRSRRRPG